MKSLFVLSILLITGCADHALQHRGTETIAYQEQHKFELSFESAAQQVELKRIQAITNQFDEQQARYELYVPTQFHQQGEQIVQFLKSIKVRPDWIERHPQQQGESITLIISQWQSVVDYCRPLTITKPHPQAGCAAETNRTIQLVNPGTRVN
ncbi:hypothetical protein VHA01S_004_01100 [Vibrio halioticoli NBRC 102217]|uniref:Uncharacterized protein n=1 Tax=Vibrio halioticoli NBRC 102217 TaxID=1219072 RepID=V5FH23_9VIBR|nr:hypothetical protein [Vibrio halioticoli]GAD88337.1 hypothetical protein VHA01S_004_01100 [Vibrio halioticoli NBRC 102217]